VTIAVVLLVVALGATAGLLTDRSALGSGAAKMAAATLLPAYLVVAAPSWTTYTSLVLVALIASWIGDLALSFDGRRTFGICLVAFAGAHLAYITAFVLRGQLSGLWTLASGVAMAILAVVILRWLAPHRPPELRIPVGFYLAIIAVMVAVAFGTLGFEADVRIPVAACLFAASDVLVARQQFVERTPTNRIIGLPLYFLAQALFVLTAVG
jgi:uncharacterized membrane protein YhhN